jgi:hypothetical protein
MLVQSNKITDYVTADSTSVGSFILRSTTRLEFQRKAHIILGPFGHADSKSSIRIIITLKLVEKLRIEVYCVRWLGKKVGWSVFG